MYHNISNSTINDVLSQCSCGIDIHAVYVVVTDFACGILFTPDLSKKKQEIQKL